MLLAEALPPTTEQARFLDRLEALRASHPHNLCARHMSRDLFLSFSFAQRSALQDCCRSGAEIPDSVVGCYILRPGDLHEFAAFFGPLIGDLHGAAASLPPAPGRDRHDDADPEALDLAALGLPALSTRARVARNLQAFPLPGRMTRADRIGLEQLMVRALRGLLDDPAYAGRVVSLTPDFGRDGPNPNRIGAAAYQALIDDHIMFRGMDGDPYMQSAGLAADWPWGRACYVSADRSVIIWIGEEDHLRIISMRTGTRLTEAYDRLGEVLAILQAVPGLGFVRDAAYGYVTSCPSNLGTGLRASVRVSLPFLTRPGVDTQAICRGFGLAARGLAGDQAPAGGDHRFDLSPQPCCFNSDRAQLAALFQGLGELTRLEPEIRRLCAKKETISG